MNLRILLWVIGALFIQHVTGKLFLDRLDQLETNLIGNAVAPPKPTLRVFHDQDWIKISDAPPAMINTKLGDRVEIECEVLSNSVPEIQWLRGDRTVSQVLKSRPHRGSGKGLLKMKSKLVIDCITRKHEGFYTCAAASGSKTIKADPTLILIDGIGQGDLDLCSSGMRQPPRIISWMSTAMENMGVDLRLPCAVVGTPSPSIYWMGPQNNILNTVKHQVGSNGDLTISNLAWSDMGEYSCVAENTEGQDISTTFVYPMVNLLK